MSEEYGRRLPVSIESEQAVLGSILIRPESLERIVGILESEDFSLEEHQKIFSTMRSMFLASRSIDVVTLVNTLVQDGVYTESGGVEYIKTLSYCVPTAANIVDYARTVKDKAVLRRLISTCDDIEESAYSEKGSAEHIVDSAEQAIFELAQRRTTNELRHIRDVAGAVYEGLTVLAASQDKPRGVRTGYGKLDEMLVHLGEGDFVIVGARPAMGKTSFVVDIAAQVAKKENKTVCIFSLEMSAEQLVNRMLAREADIDGMTLRRGNLTSQNWVSLAEAAANLSGREIYIDDTTNISVTDMKAKLRRMKNLGLVVIDYLGLMQSGRDRVESRVQEVSDISRNLKLMAKELGVPILCCAQLSRNPEGKGRGSKRPMMSDLRDSGSIEQDADIVMFLYRDDYYGSEENGQVTPSAISQIEVIIAKNRHGGTGTVLMNFDKTKTRFYDIDTISEPPAMPQSSSGGGQQSGNAPPAGNAPF